MNRNGFLIQKIVLSGIAVGLIFCVSTAIGGDLTIPNTFTSGTPAKASEVNANFSAVETAVDDNATRIATLEAAVATLQANLQTAINRIASLEGNTVLGLNGKLSLSTMNGYPTALLTGVNLQVLNGMGTTDTTNGLGNIIVGYKIMQDILEQRFVQTGNILLVPYVLEIGG